MKRVNDNIMIRSILFALFFVASNARFRSPIELIGYVPSPLITEETPYEAWIRSGKPVIDDVDWRNVNGTDFTLEAKSQFVPAPCGSCWSFGSTGALSDRIVIRSGGIRFDISPQGLLDCGEAAGSCNGGSHYLAYQFMTKNGMTDTTCSPYRGVDHSNWGESACSSRMCRICNRFGTCSYRAANETLSVKVEQFGSILGVDAMKAEISARGPIACSMYAHADVFENYKGGIIQDTTKYPGTTHVVNVVGFSKSKDGVPYWIVRNSFGTYWGELGYYRVEIGKNIYNMESSNCSWAVPDSEFISLLKSLRV